MTRTCDYEKTYKMVKIKNKKYWFLFIRITINIIDYRSQDNEQR